MASDPNDTLGQARRQLRDATTGRRPLLALSLCLALDWAGSAPRAQGERSGPGPIPAGVPDEDGPVLLLPDRVEAACTEPGGAWVEFTVEAHDLSDPDPVLTVTPPSGSLFPIGETLVVCTAVDASGNGTIGTFLVVVSDSAPLSIACPEDITIEATQPGGEVVHFTLVTTGSCRSAPLVSSVPPSGSSFALGLTPVICKAVDDSGALVTCQFRVRVQDTSAPEVHVAPVRVRIERALPGALVSFAPEVVDAVDPAPSVICQPPSGSFFPYGVTQVSCTATDASGNQRVTSFPVRVDYGGEPHPDAPRADVIPEPAPPGWYSGDTHEHVQYCNGTVHLLDEIRARMDAEDLNVASVLIWHRQALRFQDFICLLTGEPDVLSDSHRILQVGVETSGLDCSRWGHLIGLNVDPAQARIAAGSVAAGDCDDMLGLTLEGDGTGRLNGIVAERFLASPGAVCGYAHTYWPIGIYHPEGYDWNAKLLATGYTVDALFLDPGQALAVPNVDKLMGIIVPPNSQRAFLPLLGPMDAVLGSVQFFETISLGGRETFMPLQPPVHWTSHYYKLLSAGVRLGLSAGTDRACFTIDPAVYPRTYVRLDGELSYDAWVAGLAAGRTSVAAGAGTFLRFRLADKEVGDELQLASPDTSVTARLELRSSQPIEDCIELIVGGVVYDSRPVQLDGAGELSLTFDDVPLPASTWVAARLCSQRAHTGAIYVVVDGRPIVDPVAAEYWMLWCDVVAKTTLDHPDLEFFGQQEAEALERIVEARTAFKTLRDIAREDAGQGETRYGVSRAGCAGPIAIAASGPARSGEPLTLTCAHAPPLARGELVLSRGRIAAGARTGASASARIATYPVRANRGGFARVDLGPVPSGEAVLHARFVWEHEPTCVAAGCSHGVATRVWSDALDLDVLPGHAR